VYFIYPKGHIGILPFGGKHLGAYPFHKAASFGVSFTFKKSPGPSKKSHMTGFLFPNTNIHPHT
jgi:hypothetical protein